MDQVDNYFKKKNIDVSLNTLGGNQQLIDLFINETKHIVDKAHNKTSNTVKTECYDLYYKMDKRTKYTGFEKFNNLDKKCRQKMSQKTKGLVGEALEVQEDKQEVSGSYIKELKNSFKKFKNPLLYLSGGIDSEFVASAMLEEKISFTPVIFEWANDEGKILNIHDILYAMDFCSTHNLTPVVRTLNIEKLWNNPDFIDLAIETNNSSPHVNTYVYMIEMMAEEYKDSTHVLGGEIRFSRITEEGKIANYVTMAKVNPPSYNNISYTVTYQANPNRILPPGSAINFGLLYSWNGNYTQNQNWNLSWSVSSPSSPPPGYSPTISPTTPILDTWFLADTPGGTGFQYRISTDGGVTWAPEWTTFSGVAIFISRTLNIPDGDSTAYLPPVTYTIQVKNISPPVIVVQSTITMDIVYTYTPTFNFYSSQFAGTTTWSFSRPNSYIDTIGMFVIGGGGGGGGAYADPGDWGAPFRAAGGGGAGGIATGVNTTSYVGWNGNLDIGVGAGGAGGAGDVTGLAGTSSYVIVKGPETLINANGGQGGQRSQGPSSTPGGLGSGGNNLNYNGGAPAYNTLDLTQVFGGGGAGANGNGGNATASSAGTGGIGGSVTAQKNEWSWTVGYGGGGNGGYPTTQNPAPSGASSGDPGAPNDFPPPINSNAGGFGGWGATAYSNGSTIGTGTGGNGSFGWVCIAY